MYLGYSVNLFGIFPNDFLVGGKFLKITDGDFLLRRLKKHAARLVSFGIRLAADFKRSGDDLFLLGFDEKGTINYSSFQLCKDWKWN